MKLVQVLFCRITLFISYSYTDEPRELRLLGILPMSGDGWVGGGSCLPAVQMAIDDINVRDDILSEYNLTYKWIDSEVCAFFIFNCFLIFSSFLTLHANHVS